MASRSGPRVTAPHNLVVCLDAGNIKSYDPIKSPTTVNSLVGNITSSSYNSNINHSTSDGGYWSFGNNTGDGIEFDSITSFMPLGTNDMTYEIWLYKNNLINTNMAAFGLKRTLPNGTQHSNFSHFYVKSSVIGDYLEFRKTSASGGSENISSSASYNLASWNHLVISHDISAGIPKLYYNGSERSVGNLGGWVNYYHHVDDQYQLNVGSDVTYNFYGRISILRIYKGKAFNAEEVSNNYETFKHRFGL